MKMKITVLLILVLIITMIFCIKFNYFNTTTNDIGTFKTLLSKEKGIKNIIKKE